MKISAADYAIMKSRAAKKKQAGTLTKYCDMVRGNLDKLSRKKVVNIVTIEVHGRDTIDRMIKAGCANVSTRFENSSA